MHYLDDAAVLRDDRGVSGGFGSSQPFVILGDLNAPPDQDDVGFAGGAAIAQLLGDPRIQDPPSITGRPTAFFQRGTRADYVLPSAALRVLDGAVVWPDSASDPAGAARAALASDHRLVWLDLALPLLEPQR